MEILVQYTDKSMDKLERVGGSYNSAYIDLYLKEDVVISAGEFVLAETNVAISLPEGYEAILVARSSLFKKFGVILTHGYGVIDEAYKGKGDIWKIPLHRLYQPKDMAQIIQAAVKEIAKVSAPALYNNNKLGTAVIKEVDDKITIPRGTRIAQFRVVKSMEEVTITTVEDLEEVNRGGFGTTDKGVIEDGTL